jgi:hypothetical protein
VAYGNEILPVKSARFPLLATHGLFLRVALFLFAHYLFARFIVREEMEKNTHFIE